MAYAQNILVYYSQRVDFWEDRFFYNYGKLGDNSINK